MTKSKTEQAISDMDRAREDVEEALALIVDTLFALRLRAADVEIDDKYAGRMQRVVERSYRFRNDMREDL